MIVYRVWSMLLDGLWVLASPAYREEKEARKHLAWAVKRHPVNGSTGWRAHEVRQELHISNSLLLDKFERFERGDP